MMAASYDHTSTAVAPDPLGVICALKDVLDGAVTLLTPGEAPVWAQRRTERRFTLRPHEVSVRPRFAPHGEGTKSAVEGGAIR